MQKKSKKAAKKTVKKAVKKAAKTPAKKSAKKVVKKVAKKAVKKTAKKAIKKAVKKVVKKAVKKVAKKATKKVVKKVVKKVAKKVVKKSSTSKVKVVEEEKTTKKAVKSPAKSKQEKSSKVEKPSKKAVKTGKPVADKTKREKKLVSSSKGGSKTADKVREADNLKKSTDSNAKELNVRVLSGFVSDKSLNKENFLEYVLSERKLTRAAFFTEVNEAEERINKKKYSLESKEEELPTKAARKKNSKNDETMEELILRISKELEEEESYSKEDIKKRLCTKCAIMPVDPRFIVDKDLGYCEECADILHLGETKEARKIDYQLSLIDDEEDEIKEPEYGGY